MSNTSKDKNRALAGTILFHVILVVCFLFFGLSTPLPLPEEHGVIVSLGYLDEGRGQTRPLSAAPPVQQAPPEATPSQAPEPVVTQSTQESVALPATDPEPEPEAPLPDPVSEELVPDSDDVEEQVIEEEPEPVVDPRALFPGRDQRSTERQDMGETDEEGVAGDPDGAVNALEETGIGQGQGVEFSLTGRQANHLPLPEYTTLATGRVVVQITVNREGQVIRASAGARGTTTTDRTLHRNAEEAARKARFDLKADAPEEQTGTITYNFIRLN